MERAPLPPHERSWRHPSEVGPTRLDVDPDTHGRPLVLAVGTLAAVLLVAMVVTLTPRPPDGPSAISATTTPSGARTTALPRAAASARVLAADPTPRLASFVAIPNAIASAPEVGENAVVAAESLPEAGELVVVRTERVTYRIEWADLVYLDLDEGAIVLDQDGRLVARIERGYILVFVDD